MVSGEINFGKRRLSELAELKVKKHRQRSHWYRTASAVIASNVAKKERWDYRTEVAITECSQGLIRGICVGGKRLPDGSVEFHFNDASLELERKFIEHLGFFGMKSE